MLLTQLYLASAGVLYETPFACAYVSLIYEMYLYMSGLSCLYQSPIFLIILQKLFKPNGALGPVVVPP